jgi:acetoin utilization deacetylase AcuC-like enzyme
VPARANDRRRRFGSGLLRAARGLWYALRARERLALIYDARYEGGFPGVPFDSLRGEKILEALELEGLLRAEAVDAPRPASLRSLLRVHSVEYLQRLSEPEAVGRVLGTQLTHAEAERVLDLQRLMVGGTTQAVRIVLRNGGIAVHLAGGLHHASAAAGMGFCLLNDVAVAIARARDHGFDEPILVVDLDLHDGNGTRQIFASDASVHTYSIHGEEWGERDALESTSIALGHGVGDAVYLATIRDTLPGVFARFRPRLVLYLAGADPAADDVLGDWSISPEVLLERDRLVLSLARDRSLPLVVLLAGGYGDGAWRYPTRLLTWLLAGSVLEPPSEEDLLLHRMRGRISRVRTSTSLEASEPLFELSESDLPGLRSEHGHTQLFAGVLSRHSVELLFERTGFLEQLRARGFRRLELTLQASEALDQTLRINDAAWEGPLVEMRVRRTLTSVPGMELLAVDWLLLQNPKAIFTSRRPRLPGQQYPGLGLLREALAILVVLCESLGLDGLVFQAAHYHVAAMGRAHIRCLQPEDEALFRAFAQALDGLTLADAARAVADGHVVAEETGAPAAWRPSPLVLPVSERLRALIGGTDYEAAVAAHRRPLRLVTHPRAA